jgi:hypothetical protein
MSKWVLFLGHIVVEDSLTNSGRDQCPTHVFQPDHHQIMPLLSSVHRIPFLWKRRQALKAILRVQQLLVAVPFHSQCGGHVGCLHSLIDGLLRHSYTKGALKEENQLQAKLILLLLDSWSK